MSFSYNTIGVMSAHVHVVVGVCATQPSPLEGLRLCVVALMAACRKCVAYPKLSQGGPQKLLVLVCEVGGRWSAGAQRFVRDLVRLRALRAPLPCELPRLQAGRGEGGEHPPWRSSSRWRAQHWTPLAGGPATTTERRPLLCVP